MHEALWVGVAFTMGVLFERFTARGAGGPRRTATSGDPRQPWQGSFLRSAGDPDGAYRVTLVDRGPNIIKTIKVIRQVTTLGLKDAKDVVDHAPSEVIRVATAEQAQAVVHKFQGLAIVRVDGPEEVPSASGPPTGIGVAP